MDSGRSQLQSIIKVSSEVIDKTMNNNKNILVQQAERNRS